MMGKFYKVPLALVLSALLALMPFNVALSESENVVIKGTRAYATAPAVFSGAYSFLEAAAAAAGLSTGDFVATVVGITAIGTGMNLGNNQGVKFGDTAGNSLKSLIDAADYPAYETLTSEQQELWGTEENYNSAKFNSLLGSFGLADEYSSYQEGFTSSGGQSWDWSEEGQRRLNTLGSIGSSWASGAGNKISDITSALVDQANITQYVGSYDNVAVDTSTIETMPSGTPNPLYVSSNVTDVVERYAEGARLWNWISFSEPVYAFVIKTGSNTQVVAFSKNSFQYGISDKGSRPTPSYTTSTTTINGNSFNTYYSSTGRDLWVSLPSTQFSNMTFIASNYKNIAYALLYGYEFPTEPVIVDYPSTLEPTQEVYYPATGISPDTDWDNFQTSTIVPSPDDPGDSGGSSGTIDESGIIAAIASFAALFHFDANGNLLVKDIAANSKLSSIINIASGIKSVLDDWEQAVYDDSELLQVLSSIETKLDNWQYPEAFDDSDILTYLNDILTYIRTVSESLQFYTTGQLKVHDEGVYEGISDLGILVNDIKNILNLWPKGDAPSAPEIIGDFDFPELENKVDDLLDIISNLAPFGSVLLLAEVYSIVSSTAAIERPVMSFDFKFFPDQQDNVLVLDLTWLDDGKPVINFFCILMLILGLTASTIRIVELEAAA